MTGEHKFWYVRHPFSWFKKHPNIISWSKSEASITFGKVDINDKIIYYSYKEPKGIVGLFEITSKMYEAYPEKSMLEWCYDIKPLYIPKGDEWPKEFSPKHDAELSLRPMGAIFRLKPDQYRKIKSFLLGMNEPTNHEGIVALFSKIHREIGFPLIKEIRQSYPDAIVRDAEGKEKRIEFEFDSDDFRRDMEKGKHDPKECDVIVCWKDGWGQTRPKQLKLVELQLSYGS